VWSPIISWVDRLKRLCCRTRDQHEIANSRLHSVIPAQSQVPLPVHAASDNKSAPVLGFVILVSAHFCRCSPSVGRLFPTARLESGD
jgi:hypothetical protein